MKVLVIGGGGREHALVWKLRCSPLVRGARDLYCVPGNPGIARDATCLPLPDGGLGNVGALADLAESHRIDLTIIGPELPLTMGLTDELRRRGLKVFGASKAAARIEGSKVFAKEFMARHAIPTAAFETFTTSREAIAYVDSSERAFPLVVKADGLAAGKGVLMAEDREEAEAAVRALMDERRFGESGDRIVIEEFLSGVEASFFAITDGERIVPLATCQDYKRALDGDAGDNTGGMGAYSPSIEMDDALEETIMERVIRPAVQGLKAEGAVYRGVLYAGLMLRRASDGRFEPMVLEFNARFGDPETQVLMPRVAGDIIPLMNAAAMGELDERACTIRWRREWAACVVLASRGYPASSEPGVPIDGLESAEELPDTVVFHAGTRRDAPDGPVLSSGGRVLAVTSLGESLDAAVGRAYDAVDRISFDGMQFRKDIGKTAIARLSARGRP